MTDRLDDSAALLVIDFQKAIDDPKWGSRNNPEAEVRTQRLLAAWRVTARPVIHVQHLSPLADSPYRPGQPGCDFKEGLTPGPGEMLVQKRTPNAFVDSGLEGALRDRGIRSLVVAGVLLHNSVETTVRVAGTLGFQVRLPEDATASVDITDLQGRRWRAEEVHARSLAPLQGEYAQVTSSDKILVAAGALVAERAPA
jgi:nicotinamidase-related amidase